jgi:hypothetical protein
MVACSPNLPQNGDEHKTQPADAATHDINTYIPDKDNIPPCKGNNDGVIERSELNFVVGAKVNIMRNAPNTTIQVDHLGKTNDQGIIVWDLSQTQASTPAQVETVEPKGKWFLSLFPRTNLLIPIIYPGFDGVNYQVLHYDNEGLYLEGIVSERETPEQENIHLVYETPVPLLRFPLHDRKEWIVKSEARGKIAGLPFSSSDQYEIKVEGRGSLKLPAIQFDNALRIISTVRQRMIGGQTRQFYQILFFHECFGEVARIESQNNETDPKFKTAALLRFISF